MASSNTKTLPVIPLRDVVVFPQMMVPLFVGRERSIKALEEAQNKDRLLWLVAQKDARLNDPSPKDIYTMGTIGRIVQLLRLPDGTVRVLIEGKTRAALVDFEDVTDKFVARIEPVEEAYERSEEIDSLRRQVYATFENYLDYVKKIPRELLKPVKAAQHPGQLADLLAVTVNFKLEDKQTLLETVDSAERLSKVLGLIKAEIEVFQMERKLKGAGKRRNGDKTETGSAAEPPRPPETGGLEDEYRNELKELEEKIESVGLTEEAKEKAQREMKRLKMMSPMSAEAAVSRNYLDWMLSIPWSKETEENEDITVARATLEEDHYGLQKVKERILEFLAVKMISGNLKGPILCFVGPPGVGKTSIARSIARATGRDFVRLSLGGVRDEAEVRGHRRTYIGALPGKVIQHMKKAGSINPVFLLDEIDKLSSDFRGDPASALLEALDPEQNNSFNDHFLDVDYDLSKVMFLTTANYLQGIPAPLQDRMEIIELHGYTEDEKVEIARRYLIPKQIKENGLEDRKIDFQESAIRAIITLYTREAGVRSLERNIANIFRKIVVSILESKSEKKSFRITPKQVRTHLGIEKFRESEREGADLIGVANGLAWTEFGGDTLQIETLVVPGKGQLTITGKLGDVMQESAKAALMYVRSRAASLGIDPQIFQNSDIHIHVPEGAVPKDGPSAGITLATSITSALTGIPVRADIAMTGEITLRGRVLPIGGLKEKALAAFRKHIKDIIIPDDNKVHIEEIPEEIAKEITFHPVSHMDEVLELALLATPFVPLPEKEGGEKNAGGGQHKSTPIN